MNPDIATNLLAAVPSLGGYVNLIKIGVVVALTIAWAATAEWIDRDTDVVKTRREQWNLIVTSGAAVGYIVLLIPPWSGNLFLAGIVCWLAITGGAVVGYIIHRNGRVVPAARILTVGHLKRILASQKGTKKRAGKDKGVRVRIEDHQGDFVETPDDPEEFLDFEAVQDFLHELLWRRASDADVLAGKEKYRLVYKIDGVANEQPDGIPPEKGERLFRFLKRIAGLNAQEFRRPQSGVIAASLLSHSGSPAQTEVTTSGTTAGERMRLHIQSSTALMRLHELGMHPHRQELLKKKILGKSKGLTIVSATPRSGMTTTQYAILRSHDAYMNNIYTLERRSNVDLDNITQHIYEGSNTDVNYARMLQTVLRREPDIVLVSECEDRETAKIATRAAMEDRKVYLGMIAKDSFEALAKYLSYVEDNKTVAKTILGVLNQRLVRLLCEECRDAFRPDETTLKKLNLPVDKIERFYRPPTEPKRDRRGKEILCPNCQGTGYVGRTGVFELLIVDDAVRSLIAEGAPINRIKAQCRKNKMYYLQEEGLLKVIDGVTSMNEVLRCLRADN